jgi:hemolysin activation/secretion protein
MMALCSASLVASIAAGRENSAPVIDRIEIVVEDVFEDEGQTYDFWAYRLANHLHIDTHEEVIRQELLFREGESLDEEALAQTERNLRALPFLRDARIDAVPDGDDNRVVVRVVASDSWTTRPELHLAKVGNEWVWAAGISEENLFGRGKQLRALYDVGLDREETYLFYRDPRLLGSRFALGTLFSSASDGHHAALGLQRPFFSLQTRWGFRLQVDDFERLDPLYEDGKRVSELRHVGSSGELEISRAVRRRPSSALRLHLAYGHTDDDVELDRRRFGFVRIGLTSVSHDFRKLTHVNRFESPEDFNLGNQASAFFALSTPALGGEPGTSYFFSLSERRGLSLSRTNFLLGGLSWQGRQRHGRLENGILRARLDWIFKFHPKRLLLAKADFHQGTNLDPEVQLRLGAESGLRGYPVRQFNGNRSLLLSAEVRWFLVDDLARLVSLGVAAFADTGYAWPAGSPVALRDFRSDVGVSLLVGRNRVAASRPGVRFDLAYALDPVPGRSRWLFSAGSQIGF